MDIPKVIKKDNELILKDIESKALYYTPEWKYGTDGEFGTALSKIFAHLLETIIKRLNQAPYKHFITFLEMLNTSPLPPKPGQAPLTFFLSKGTTENVFIPSSTQASAQDEDGEPVYFETEKSIVATPSKLLNVYSVNRISDEIYCHSASIDGINTSKLFSGINLQKHVLYIGEKDIFNIKKARIAIKLQGQSEKILSLLSNNKLVSWQYGAEWQHEFNEIEYDKNSDNILLYKNSDEHIDETMLFNIKSRWIRCIVKNLDINLFDKIKIEHLKVKVFNASEKFIDIKNICDIGDEFYEKLTGKESIVKINSVSKLLRFTPDELSELLNCEKLKAENILEAAKKEFYNRKGEIKLIEETGVIPDMAFCNDVSADLSKKIYPFGIKPQLYSTFYIASEEVFSKKGYNINILLKLIRGTPSSYKNSPKLSWEYWDGETWRLIEGMNEENMASSPGATPVYTIVNTIPPPEECLISISRLPELKKLKVNGKENYWIRIRLTGGDYGCEFNITTSNQIISGNYNPPEIHSIKLEYYKQEEDDPDFLILENNCEHKITKQSFIPFKALIDQNPSIYFCFDRKLKNGPIGLFINIDEIEYPEDFLPAIKWKFYSESHGWKDLDIKDETSGFTKSGIIFFSIDEEMKPLSIFGEENKYWLKASVTGDFFKADMLPAIKGFYLNTTWSSQIKTVKDEIIGSGNTKALQHLNILNPPVIDITLMVNELNSLSESEMHSLQESGVFTEEKKDTKGKIIEFWVEWKEVSDFLNSSNKDRHYVIDRASGSIWFGDGINGMPPPYGKDNIKAIYSSGGGKKGNLKSGEINKLQSSIASVNKVCNIIASEGGIDIEDTASLFSRAPAILKNRGRVITADDYYDIIKEEIRDIAKIKILSNLNDKELFETGWVTVVIIPQSENIKPYPSPALRRKVKDYLLKHCHNIVSIRVIPPFYLKADVFGEIHAKVIEKIAETENEVKKIISNFFHPLIGAADGKGWDFGEIPCISDLYSILKKIDNVNYINNLYINLYSDKGAKIGDISDLSVPLSIPAYSLIYAGENNLTIRSKSC